MEVRAMTMQNAIITLVRTLVFAKMALQEMEQFVWMWMHVPRIHAMKKLTVETPMALSYAIAVRDTVGTAFPVQISMSVKSQTLVTKTLTV